MMKSDNSNINELCIPGELNKLSDVRAFVESKAKSFGFDENEVYKIVLAVDEACSNLIRHSFQTTKANNICIEINSNSSEFIIAIIDNGTPFNLALHSSPDMNNYFKNFQHGGLGIHIIKSVMDSINYSIEADRNILKLTKFLKSA